MDTRNGEYVSGNFFRTFGVQPWIGRLLTDEDDQEGAPPVAVMSYRIWHDKYGSDPSVVGAGYQINGHPFTVIGVAAPGFFGAKLAGWGMPDFWLPLTTELLIDGETARLKRPNTNFLDLIGRVRPGVNPKSLEAKLKVEFYDWLASHVPDMEPGEKQLWQQQTLHLVPGGAGVAALRDEYEDGLKLLLVAAGCVLLVACGNLANLMLARGLKDRAQTSIRVALGAPRGRLVRKSLVECVMLAAIGGALGHRRGVRRNKIDFASGVPDRRTQQLRADQRDSIFTCAAVHTGHVRSHGNHFRDCAGVDDFACRPDRGASRRKPFGGGRSLVGAEVPGDRAGSDVAGTALRSGSARPEPAEPAAPEFWIRDAGPVHRVDQSRVWEITSRNKWNRCSGKSTIACSRFPACAWWRLRFMRR